MRKFAFQAASILALVSSTQLFAAQTQAAQAGTCLTRPELRGMVAYFLPTLLQSTIEKCSDRLKPDSYLIGRAPRLLGTLEAGRSEAWPMAKKAFLKMGGEDKGSSDIFASLPEDAVRPIVEAVITQKLGDSIKPESCGDIDRIMTPLEPLPAANLIDTVVEVMAVAGRNDKQMRVCRES